jgi:hypothetical protein
MAMPTDTLSTPPPPNRVYYSLGRMLGVEDFQADQDYHRGRLARALLQLCGTGTVAGLNVSVPQIRQAGTPYPAFSFVFDSSQNVQVTKTAGISGGVGSPPFAFAATPGSQAADGTGIVWINEGPINTNGWRPNTPFPFPSAIVDSNSNVQILNVTSNFTSSSGSPQWQTAIGSTTADGSNPAAWTCVGPSQLEIQVTAGLAIDRVGRMIEVPRPVCIRLQPWLANQSSSDLTSALHSGNILVDVFATFIPCTRGVTPCFATQDDYDATDAFSPNRLLDSFAMQLVLRTDSNPQLPQDPWLSVGPAPTTGITPIITQELKQTILSANSGPAATSPFSSNGPAPGEYPPDFDLSAVFLARLSIPATNATTFNLTQISIDNLSRLFLFPLSLVGRCVGLSSGLES